MCKQQMHGRETNIDMNIASSIYKKKDNNRKVETIDYMKFDSLSYSEETNGYKNGNSTAL